MPLKRCPVFLVAVVATFRLFGLPQISVQGQGGLLTPADTLFSGFGMMSHSGSGLPPDQIVCQSHVNTITVDAFDRIHSFFLILANGCASADQGSTLTFTVTLQDLTVLMSSQQLREVLMIEHFSVGENSVSIIVCQLICKQATLLDVTVTVKYSSGRLFPYGYSTSDDSFSGVLDGYVPIYPLQSVPFFKTYHKILFISSNGLVSFDQFYTSGWPIPFPFGRSRIPVIAPFWTDFDFRVTSSPSSRIFYNVYDKSNNSTQFSRIQCVMFDHLKERIADSDYAALGRRVDFEAEWMTIITWNHSMPYHNIPAHATFQLVLATDFVQTFAFYLYEDSTLNLPNWQRFVIGYDSKDFTNYRTIQLDSPQDYMQVNNVIGNTEKLGEWFFDFTSAAEDVSAEARCLLWAKQQIKGNINPASLPRCPCTRKQAFRDWNFWFAYYWGLSSRSNCAMALFSRMQSTTECCYDSTGALLVGPSQGGTYQLYNPLFFFQSNYLEDLSPYQDCCVHSKRCHLYYRHRPSDDCSAYIPPRFQFTFGDPHFRSVDNLNFTFNGIGEYVLVQTPSSHDFHIHGRLRQLGAMINGTVLSAVVITQGSALPIQIQRGEDEEIEIYIGGIKHELSIGQSPIIVTSLGVISTDVRRRNEMDDAILDSMDVTMSSMVFVRVDVEFNVVISTSEGASVSVAAQEEFLWITVELPEHFTNATAGLLGKFNGDPEDDLRDRQGVVLSINANIDKDIYQFGLMWHLTEEESFFNYSIGNTSYSAINDGYMDYLPVFTEDLVNSVSDNVIAICKNDLNCIYDLSLTGDRNIGLSTYNISLSNSDIIKELSNSPPAILGNFFFFAEFREEVTHIYKAEDPDGDEISSFILKEPVDGFTFAVSGDTIEVTWSSAGLLLPTHPLQLFVNDTEGGMTLRSISVILCSCVNNGSCLGNINSLELAEFDGNNHYKLPCSCIDFFGGDSCQIDMRGCGLNTCQGTALCRNESSETSGYVCDDCFPGFMVFEASGKCIDMDECSTPDLHNCTQMCTNTEGSYLCSCLEGYKLSMDQTCKDIDECRMGTSNCSQTCVNFEGGFTCGCEHGCLLDTDNRTCIPSDTCTTEGICDSGLQCIEDVLFYECLCPIGQQCKGMCSGSINGLSNSSQTCHDCPPNMYGVRCNSTCQCAANGDCVAEIGCVCHQGWTGKNCDIELNDFSPVFAEGTPSMPRVHWDVEESSLIATIVATDEDTGSNAGQVTYSLRQPLYPIPPDVSDGMDIFEIDSRTGRLTLSASARNLSSYLETFSEFLLTIRASDGGLPSRSVEHTLIIKPISVPLFEPGSRRATIDEESVLGTSVLNLNCAELGPPSGSIRLSLTGDGASNFIVEITRSAFSLIVARRIDYEALSENERVFDLIANCSNHFGLSSIITLEVEIDNIDDNVFSFDSTQYRVVVSENASHGAMVLSVRAKDRDFPDAHITYHIKDSDYFGFIPDTNTIVVTGSLDRETVDNYSLSLQADYMATTGSSVSAYSTLKLDIADVNDVTPLFVPSIYIINNITSRAQIGDLVVTVFAIDTDLGFSGQVSFELEKNTFFGINATNGDIYVSSSLFPVFYRLSVQVVDLGSNPLSASTSVNINVQPYPDHIQLCIPDDPISVPEDIPIGSLVGQLLAQVLDYSSVVLNHTSDLDLSFSILNGTDANRFVISHTTGEIFTLESLDYDADAVEYYLLLNAVLRTDDSEISNETVVLIKVVNIDDNPPQFVPEFYATVVEQFTPSGVDILTVHAIDPDQLASINFTLYNTDDIPFEINSTSGEITASEALERARDYRFRVLASDGRPEESSTFIFISVTRSTSIAPSFTKDQFVFTLSENAEPGTYIGTVTALVRGNLSVNEFGFRISMPDSIDFNVTDLPLVNISASVFHIDQSSGNISTQTGFEFDLESRRDFLFYVEAYNIYSGMVYDFAAIKIELLDKNDNAPQFRQSLYTRVINTSQLMGSVILVVCASDRDSKSNGQVTYMYSMMLSQNNLFLGFALNVTSGAISVSNTTLLPGDYYLTIIALDEGMPSLSDEAKVFVAILPTTHIDIDFTENPYIFKVAEDAPHNSIVGMISVVKENNSLFLPNVTYSIPNVMDCFGMDASSGELKVTCTRLDREIIAGYELVVEGRVSDTVAVLGTVQIVILDINDNAPKFSLDVYTRVIDNRYCNKIAVLQIVAIDNDFGNNATVSYVSLPQNNPIFRIDKTSGEVFVIEDTIEAGDHRLSIYAIDHGTPTLLSSSALVLISVIRAHPQTLEFQSTTLNISENAPRSTTVGMVVLVTNGGNVVNPGDFPNNLKFSIVGGDMSDNFSINPDSGLVISVAKLDREEAPFHMIKILANFTQFNIPLWHIESYFVIDVLDINEKPRVDNSLYESTIDDSAIMGHVIVNISATDFDTTPNALVNFTIDPDPPSVFDVRVTYVELPKSFGEIFVNSEDSLVPGVYSFNLIATDSSDPLLNSTAARVIIIVNHTIPKDIFFTATDYFFYIPEDFGHTITGSLVGNVSVLPYTPALDQLVYEITGGSGENYFHIQSPSGLIRKLHKNIDRERNASYVITIRAHLPEHYPSLTAETNVSIDIDDLNDNAPVFDTEIGLYPTIGLDRDEINTSSSFLTISANDIDIGRNSEIEYGIEKIVLGNSSVLTGAMPFMVYSDTGQVLPSFPDINVGTYHLTFTAMDRGNPPMSDRASVTVIVQFPAPNSFTFSEPNGYTFSLEENQTPNRFGDVQLQNIPDYLERYLNFSMTSRVFSIVQSSGVISNRRLIDFEVDKIFTYLVTARLDVSSRVPELQLIAFVNVTTYIQDVNDNTPYFINFPTEITQVEELLEGEVVYTIQANDSDSGSNARLMFEILNTDIGDMLSIDNATGEIMTLAVLDREDNRQGSNHNVMIRVCDMGSMRHCEQDATIFRLLDINDNSPHLTSGVSYSVDERSEQGRIFSLSATDPDKEENGTVLYYFQTSNIPFMLNYTNGGVDLVGEVDYEMRSEYIISLMLVDNSSTPMQTLYTNVTIAVNDLPDSTPQFSKDNYQVSTGPTIMEDDVTVQVTATDADIPSSNDTLLYVITSIHETGNEGAIPDFRIEPTTGAIFSNSNQIFRPEARFVVSILVYDQSNFNLSNSVNVTINVIPEPLTFTNAEYTVNVQENTIIGTLVMVLSIQPLTVSSDLVYTLNTLEPTSPKPVFAAAGNGLPAVNITLAGDLNREMYDYWRIEVVARRGTSILERDRAMTILIINVGDVNDQRPVFTYPFDTVITIREDLTSQTFVTRVHASDLDIGDNGRLKFSFDNPPRDFPFTIDQSTGNISTTGDLDYENVPSYNMTVLIQDSGVPVLDNHMTYLISIVNVNDNFPEFKSPAYFGEMFARAPVNSFLKHTELTVSDADDVNDLETLSFRIYQPQLQTHENYLFRVTPNRPFRIQVVQISVVETFSHLLELRVEVMDQGGKTVSVPLYLSIFTSSNLVFYQLEGVDLNTLLSCQVHSSSMCTFRESIATITKQLIGTDRAVTFFNNTAEVSPFKPNVIIVGLYGWHGGLDSRERRGELPTNNPILPVQYITYDKYLFNQVAISDGLFYLSFSVSLQEVSLTTATEPIVPTTTIPNNTLLGVVVAIVLAILVVVLVIVLVCVLGRRINKPKKKKKNRHSSDLYERNASRLRQQQKHFKGSREHIPLQSTGPSDQAYETMYIDDDILNTNQTMPWFDPKYLASSKEYDGDMEQSVYHPQGDKRVPLNLRATVDGDARWNHRHSLDESAGPSITKLDPSDYLKGYQSSVPKKLGQKVDLDTFASRRDHDRDKLFSPDFEHAKNWNQPHPPIQPILHQPEYQHPPRHSHMRGVNCQPPRKH